jgi:hypothetical protein
MWNIQTQLHNDASIIDKDQEYTLMKELALQNQRRFRIKRTINYNLGSKHAEQKGYKGKRIFILSHLDVDNQLCINGGIRYLATLFDEVCLVVKRDTEVRLKQLYKNEPAITFYNVNNETDISPRFGCAINIFETITKSYDKVLLCGLHKHDTLLNSLNIVLHEDINVSPSLSSNWSLIA